MTKIANKLVELRQRARDLEVQIARHGRQEIFLAEHSRLHRGTQDAVDNMQKRLTSLKRSCEILSRHLTLQGQAAQRFALDTVTND
jgi:hypothetical protein